MNACRHCWAAYIECMERSRATTNAVNRRLYIQDAYAWLDRWFAAVEREMLSRQGALN